MDDEQGSVLRPKRTHIIGLYTQPPAGATVVCADELGPVSPRTFAPAPGWSIDGHRIKAPLEYSRSPDKIWVYGSIRVRDGQAVTLTAGSRNSVNYQRFLEMIEQASPTGDIYVITDNLSSHNSNQPANGSKSAHGSNTPSSRSEHAGSTCKNVVGEVQSGCGVEVEAWPDRLRSLWLFRTVRSAVSGPLRGWM